MLCGLLTYVSHIISAEKERQCCDGLHFSGDITATKQPPVSATVTPFEKRIKTKDLAQKQTPGCLFPETSLSLSVRRNLWHLRNVTCS